MDNSNPSKSNTQGFTVFDAQQTYALLDIHQLIEELKTAAQQYRENQIISPERVVLPRTEQGVMLSMPATSEDLSIHKLVNVEPGNGQKGLPTIFGLVSVFDSQTGQPLCVLDGPTVTGVRTAAVSMTGIDTFLPSAPEKILLIGTGTQALYHLKAIHQKYPQCQVKVRGSSLEKATDFCQAYRHEHDKLTPCQPDEVPENTDVVILLTTSKQAIYNEAALTGRLIIGVGAFKPDMAEIGVETLAGSTVYVDDPAGAREEAGDLIQADIDWSRVQGLISALNEQPDLSKPIVFKTVGSAAWDLAAARTAQKLLP